MACRRRHQRPVATQQAVLDHTGLTEHIDGWCISEAERVRKPNSEIFWRAARRCGGDTARGWMVGDHPAADIEGGRQAGLRTIWIHRGRTFPAGTSLPDHSVAAPQADSQEPCRVWRDVF